MAEGICDGKKPEAGRRFRDYVKTLIRSSYRQWQKERLRHRREVSSDFDDMPDPCSADPNADDRIHHGRPRGCRARSYPCRPRAPTAVCDQGCVDDTLLHLLWERGDQTSEQIAQQLAEQTGRAVTMRHD